MVELVNDMLRPTSAPCRVSWLGDECDEPNYKSWRRVAIGLRQTLLDANWSKVSPDFHRRVVSWLKTWIDATRSDNMITTALDVVETMKSSDPSVPDTERFPRDLKWYQGTYTGESRWMFVPQTKALVAYIVSGKGIYDDAVRAGAIGQKSGAMEQAEKTAAGPIDFRPWLIRGGLIMVVVGFGVWAIREIARAAKIGKELGK